MKLLMTVVAIFLSAVCSTAAVADRVGVTVDAARTVRATGGSKARLVVIDTAIFRNDRLRANASGNAQIRLIDGTKIIVGPNADVKIDEFVYSGRTVKKLTVSATRGAFRFISGRSNHSAYKIKTPTGTIGVRGTAFDVTITRDGTNIALLRGAVRACDRRGRCREVRNRCDYVLIGRRGVTQGRLNAGSVKDRANRLFPLLVNESKLRRQFKQHGSDCTARAQRTPDPQPQRTFFDIFKAPIKTTPAPVEPVTTASNPPASSPPASSPPEPSDPPVNAGVPNNPGNDRAVGNAGEKFSSNVRGNSANAPGLTKNTPGNGARGKSGSAPGHNK